MTLAALALILLIGPDPSAYDAAACAIYKELIEINTTDPLGDNTRAAEAVAARLRILPGTPAADVQATLVGVLADHAVAATAVAPAKPRPPSPLSADIMQPVDETTREMWP